MGCYRVGVHFANACFTDEEKATWDVQNFARAAQMMESMGVSDEQLCERVALVVRTVADATKRPVQVFTLVTMGDGLIYRLLGFGTVEDAANLEETVAIALNQGFDDSLSRLVSFAISPGALVQRPTMTLKVGL